MKLVFCKLKLTACIGKDKESAHRASLRNLISQTSSEIIKLVIDYSYHTALYNGLKILRLQKIK
jgi:hypothetical protein